MDWYKFAKPFKLEAVEGWFAPNAGSHINIMKRSWLVLDSLCLKLTGFWELMALNQLSDL
ncbi:hypothetical protein PROH_19140 [Prochlorothrix hollandica PCC 9006 = CALU 1027]|uniref:Uncharacterized protein n=1 Tax=Prochlorothrix hollandica PCC 9006 = CALU 1027 TaxID=317619 RepID=A0A0M2PUH1_PROHO|nr:hypothetical protein PROH_19140 [Prochlorothrix hollandica PCC 9006 = CALU 1027]